MFTLIPYIRDANINYNKMHTRKFTPALYCYMAIYWKLCPLVIN